MWMRNKRLIQSVLKKRFHCVVADTEKPLTPIYIPSKDNVKHLYVAIERLTFSYILLPHSVTCDKTQAQNVWLHNAANLSLLILMDLYLCFWDFSLFLILTLQFSKETWTTNLPGRCQLSVTLSYPPWWGHSFSVRQCRSNLKRVGEIVFFFIICWSWNWRSLTFSAMDVMFLEFASLCSSFHFLLISGPTSTNKPRNKPVRLFVCTLSHLQSERACSTWSPHITLRCLVSLDREKALRREAVPVIHFKEAALWTASMTTIVSLPFF